MDPTVKGNEYLRDNLKSIINSEKPIEKVIELNVPKGSELSQSVLETLFKFGHEYDNYLKNIENIEIRKNFIEYLQNLINTYSFLVGSRRFPEIKKEDFIEKLDFDDSKYDELKDGLHIQNKYINGSLDEQASFFQTLFVKSGFSIDKMQLYGYILTKGDDKIIIKQEGITTDERIPLFSPDYTIPEDSLEIFKDHSFNKGDVINLEPYINILLLSEFTDIERLQKENNEIMKILNEIIEELNNFITKV